MNGLSGPAWAATLLALVTGLTGCTGCQPLLEVRHCADHQCLEPSPDSRDVRWDEDLAAQWPHIDALMDKTPEGDHVHRQWTRDQELDLWQAFNVTGDAPELLVSHDGDRFRIRVLSCG